MPVRKADQKIRQVKIDKNGRIEIYKALKGAIWSSGWDDRVRTIIDTILAPGTYRISFYPSGEASGSDAIVYLKIEKFVKGKYLRVKGVF
jgi:hypothetical protein